MDILRFESLGKVSFVEAPKPACDADTVVLKVAASAPCGSELGRLKGARRDAEGFYNTGHEVVGVIEGAPSGSGFESGMRVGARVVQDFAKAVAEDRPAPIPGEAGVAMIALEEAIFRSAETGAWESVG